MSIVTETHGKSTSVRTADGKLIGFIHTESGYASVVITPAGGEAIYRTVATYDAAIALFEALTANPVGEETYTGEAVTGPLSWSAWTEGGQAYIFVANRVGAPETRASVEIAATVQATYDELLRIETMLAFTIAKLAVER